MTGRRAGQTRRNLTHAPRTNTTNPLDYRVAGDPGPETIAKHSSTPQYGSVITMSPREARLRARTPKSVPTTTWRAVIDPVVRVILSVPERSKKVDEEMHTVLSQFAWHCERNYGLFDPQQHIDEADFERFIASRALKNSSKNTYHSRLRYIAARGPAVRNKMKQPDIGRPYSPAQFEGYVRAAFELHESWRADALMLLDLSGRLGLHNDEIAHVTGSQVVRTFSGLRLHIANADGTLREIPVTGQETTRRLEPLIGSDQYLVRPKYRNRRNAISSLVHNAGEKVPAFAGYQARLARHMWIVDLMQMAVPARHVIYLAGLRPGTNTIEALSQYVHEPSADHVHKTLINAYAQKAARQ